MKKKSTVQQEPLFSGPESNWTAPKISQLPQWSMARRIAIDCETRDDNLKTKGSGAFRGEGKLVGVSFAFDGGPAYYLPLAHYRGGNVTDPSQALMYLRKNAAEFTGEVVGMNLPYDLGWLLVNGVRFGDVTYRDVRVNEALIDEFQEDYSLQGIAERYLLPGKDEYLLAQAAKHYGCDPKAQLWALPAKYVGPYAEQDAALALDIIHRQQKRIDEQHLSRIVSLESSIIPVILKMQARGVRINFDKLDRVEAWALEQEKEALETVFVMTGHRIKVGDTMWPLALAPALTAAGVKLSLTENGQPHIDRFVLEQAGPVGERLGHARKVAKLRNTFVASIREHVANGRIHCTLNQLVRPRDQGDGTQGARFGRISCSRPNLQQQPSRDEFAPMWRDIYEPEEGSLWGSADYSQQEPRMQTHYAVLEEVKGANAAMFEYHTDPNLDHHDMMAKLTGLERKYAKSIYLGLCYGMGSGKLARSLGLPTEVRYVDKVGKYMEVAGPEAMAIIKTFRQKAPHVTALAKVAEKQAAALGYLVTIGGRKCRFPKNGEGFDWTYKAMNRLIQGSSADQTKMAMVALDNEGYFMQLQIHDSIEASVQNVDELRRIAEIMRHVVTLKVPCKVDYKIGQSWGTVVPPEIYSMARLYEAQGGRSVGF